LLAYATEQEALNHLVKSAPPVPDETATVTSTWRAAVSALSTEGSRPVLEPDAKPLPKGLEAWAQRVGETAAFQFLLGNLRPEYGVLSIGKLIAVQKFVYAESRSDVEAVNPSDIAGLFRLTTPEPALVQRVTVKDQASLSYTMASENPNLRIGGMVESEHVVATASGAQMPLHVYGFFVTFGGPWMHVARFQGRWFLRDGYHRAYNLLKRGIDRIPCVIVSANSLEDLGFVRPGFVGPEVLLGDRPPMVGDFVDDSRAVDGSIVPVRKVVRIRAEEFVITSDD